MKKITNLLIVCSLALAGAVTAQEPTPEESPGSKKQRPDKKAPAEVKPKAPEAPKTEAPAVAPKTDAPPVTKPEKKAPDVAKPEKKAPDAPKTAPATTETKPSAEKPATASTPAEKKQQSTESRTDKKAPAADVKTPPSTTPAATQAASTPAAPKTTTSPAAATTATTPATATASATPAAKATATAAATTTTASATPATTTTASATPAAATTASATPATATTASATPATAQTTATVNPAAVKKPDPQKIEQIRQRTVNFSAQPRPDRVPTVTFSPGYRIQGAEQWQGPQYEVYRTYRPERRDQAYYRSRYQRVELIAGGYYYFHNNYWYPAWGYDPRNEYYAYDAPIYAGKRALPPDKVIAEVQAVLQEMGYYKGEVDGLIGPLTRAALTGYQRDNGMTVTAVIDEPTLESLGMS